MINVEELALAVGCINHQLKGIAELHHIVSKPVFSAIIEDLSQYNDHSKRIVVAGVGKNANVAAKISETMVSLGIPSLALNVAHAAHGDFGFVGPKDAVIYISKSGKTKELVECAQHMRIIKPKVLQILLHLNSSLEASEFFDHNLCCGDVVEGDVNRLAPTSSTTTLLCALDTISVVLSHRIGWKPKDFLSYHPSGSLGDKLRLELGDH